MVPGDHRRFWHRDRRIAVTELCEKETLTDAVSTPPLRLTGKSLAWALAAMVKNDTNAQPCYRSSSAVILTTLENACDHRP